MPRFSYRLTEIELWHVCVYSTLAMQKFTRSIVVSFITPVDNVREGEELILEIHAKPIKPKGKRTWRDAALDEEKAKKRQNQKNESKTSKSGGSHICDID